MNKILIVFLVTLILNSCDKKTEIKKLANFDKDGKLIVYSAEVYAKMWSENRNLKITVIDTFCINQRAKAKKDIKNGKLVYYGFHPREFKKLTKMLSIYGIETKEHLPTCARIGSFELYCYQNEMYNEINRKFGKHFIDSLYRIAQKEFVIANPNLEYMEDGIDLREKYKYNKK